jgi:hypothetical protein
MVRKMRNAETGPKIISIGSCLSRLTANCYAAAYGGKKIASIESLRSDLILGHLIHDPCEPKLPDRRLLDSLQFNGEQDEEKHRLYLNLQYQWLNGEKSPGSLGEVLQHLQPDIIICDPFYDIIVKCMVKNGNPLQRVFFNDRMFSNAADSFYLEKRHSSGEVYAEKWKKILQYTKEHSLAKTYFINFPLAQNDQDTQHRAQRLAKRFSAFPQDESHMTIGLMPIEIYQKPGNKYHLLWQQYACYAGLIYHHYNAIGWDYRKIA